MWPCNRKKKKKESTPTGRKYGLALIFAMLLVGTFAIASQNPILIKIFPEVAGGLVAIFLVFCGGNVSNKAVLGKWQGARVSDSLQINSPENLRNDERGG